MKRTGNRIYFYYGVLELLKRNNNELYRIVLEAQRVLEKESAQFLGRELKLSEVPYNVVSIDKRNRRVSFLWYKDFWTSEKPELLYGVTVDLQRERYSVVFRPKGTSEWPWNYIHRKELFVEGLEDLVLDPYGNGMTLAWNASERKDEWKPLPWFYKKIIAKISSKDNTVINVSIDEEKFTGKTAIIMIKIV